MTGTAADLVTSFNAVCAYTQSDEITLVFAPVDTEAKQTAMFSGRVQKISTLLAGYASARFNHVRSVAFIRLASQRVGAATVSVQLYVHQGGGQAAGKGRGRPGVLRLPALLRAHQGGCHGQLAVSCFVRSASTND